MTEFPDNLAADPPPFDPRAQTQTVFKVQLGICSGLGLVISLLFCVLRKRFPVIYAIRPYRNKNIRMLPGTLFGWIPVLYDISPEEVLQVAGLDAYVFLRFFRMCVKILLVLSVLGIAFMCPVRYWLTGHFDRDLPGSATGAPGGPTGDHFEPPGYLLLCTIFTYVFTLVVYYFMFSETRHIIRTRQRFLGSQKSLTDRTIMITNVPAPMRDETALKTHIEQLGVGRVDSVFLARDYTVLQELFVRREAVRSRLEALYSRYYGLEVHVLRPAAGGAHGAPAVALRGLPGGVTGPPGDATGSRRPLLRLGPLGLVGRKVDAIRHFSWLLVHTDGQIRRLKHRATFRPIPCAFVSMKSVTDAQMAAQALFSPNPSQLETCLAPAPFDIAWNNLLLSSRQVFMRRNVIEMLCMAFSALLIVPIRYITSLLNVQYIKKLWPEFGRYLLAHDTLRTLVTGVLPTYLFTIINTILPYCIYSLCQLQGMPSKGEMELSVVKKNFMYIFFNMFLVFTLFGTFTSYRALLSDTTKIAPLLAKSIESLSLFYVDLIVLHGFTILPLQLLQFGDLLLDFWHCVICRLSRTPRTLRDLFYKPTIFQVGLVLPQHILILIIISSTPCSPPASWSAASSTSSSATGSTSTSLSTPWSTRTTARAKSGPSSSSVSVSMFGTLALEKSYVPAGLIIPLFPTTLIAMMYFKRNYLPLLNYIALDAIKTDGLSVDPGSEDDFESFIRSAKPKKRGNSVVLTDGYYDSAGILHVDNPDQSVSQSASQAASPTSDHGCALDDTDIANLSQSTLQNQHMIRRKPSTIEEQREALQNYVYPYLVDPLDGPLVGFLGDYIDTIRYRKNVVYRHAAYGSVQDQEVYHDLERDFEEHSDLEVEIVRTENSQNEYD
ncbi:hypothetical protein BRETT_003817 [Brettanomyces bruxellensis]|uniref:DUF221-domain-containing protein n=1 Tax=Dekkera bruxellensis TaxID=5007 RepID=A0A871R358_DEKBR|nr:uncharacterized protein BRETT_003817 [Brettanomyces bruxellensis]QOU19666.1 hypothetical protein BRETT_003817 [Brettanomyces bruxellensis]